MLEIICVFRLLITVLADEGSGFRICKCNLILQRVLELLLIFLVSLILLICVLVVVAFLNTFRTKGSGYVHAPKGPNKVGYVGINLYCTAF